MVSRIEEITQKLVVNAVTGTPGSASFKERELRQRLIPELLAAERGRILADAVSKAAMCPGCDVFAAFVEDLRGT
jgi:hypothetical protein